MSEFKPNTTAYPNFLFEIMHLLCESEIKVLNGIVRKTYGWHKEKDKISLSQMMKLTGLSRQACQDGKDGLVKKGIIKAEIVDGITEYMVIEPDQSKPATSLLGDKPSLLEPKKVVVEVGTQKKELQNKITKEKNIPAHIQSLRVEEKKDPHFPTATFEQTDMILNVIQEHLDKYYKRVIVNREQRRWATQIYENLRDDDKEKQLRDMLNLYTFGEGSEKNKYWLDTTPQPKILYKAWDSLVNLRLPIWFERGFTSQAEYEADLIKTKPASHSSMDDLKRQFFSGPLMSKEEAENALMELDQLKETINGKNKLTA